MTASRRRSWLRVLGLLAAVLMVVAASAGAWMRGRLVASLPQLDGERRLAGLAAVVRVERDGLDVPTISGADRLDVVRALGFVHAQDRFFQMDLLRRSAAGELAELVGRPLVAADRDVRVHRFRDVARRVVERASADEREQLGAYAAGVNAGFAALAERPFEYLLLRADPAPWRPEDSVLAILAMFITLQDERGRRESDLGVLADALPAPLFEFLAPRGTEWDAPVLGKPFAQPSIPGPEVLDLRKAPAPPASSQAAAADPGVPESVVGSNNWAVAGRRSADGRAILANDMHLPIAVPNTWYRASLAWRAAGGEARRITGVTLPGVPAVVVGSNGHVAWGFTNSYGDFGDLVVLETDPSDPDAYRTPAGARRIERITETIRVKGAADETLVVEQTIWGPVIDRDHRGRPRALRWTAHDPAAIDLGLRLDEARTVDDAMAVANRAGIPAQNFVCADAAGHIGWTIAGMIPRRLGFDGRLPGSWADGSRGWDGWLDTAEYPRIVDPPDGLVWTANARVVDGDMLARLGDGGYDLGARARQVRDGLRALAAPSVGDMLRIQLDDRALFLARWQELLLRTLTAEAVAADTRRGELRSFVESWGGRATVDSVGYRLVRAFRGFVEQRVFEALTASCRRADERFSFRRLPQREGPLWALVSERPPHLLPPPFETWNALLLAAAGDTLDAMAKLGGPLSRRTWGERNSPAFSHPLSSAVPLLPRWLDIGARPLPGDANMPRVQNGDEGASERLAVSPGREDEGYFHMPCGQSGHPLSPHYRDSHPAWVAGEPTRFLPGPAAHTLVLRPE